MVEGEDSPVAKVPPNCIGVEDVTVEAGVGPSTGLEESVAVGTEGAVLMISGVEVVEVVDPAHRQQR